MPVIKNKILPFGKKFFAINLCGLIFAKGECSEEILNHESIHSRQMLELLILPFYILYIFEWSIKILKYKDNYQAYKSISFEREAYANQKDLKYLEKRKPYGFIKYYIS
ncbi:MAG: hypothetical protein J1F12_07075 [Muribaculaceae bacterium]|nr:hypothetical protein [Muribaculaceae bacterium]